MVRRASMEPAWKAPRQLWSVDRPRRRRPSQSRLRRAAQHAGAQAADASVVGIRKELLPPGIAGDVVGAMLAASRSPGACRRRRRRRRRRRGSRVSRRRRRPSRFRRRRRRRRAARRRRANPRSRRRQRRPSNGSAAASLKAATAAAGVLARQRWKKAQLTVVAARGFGGGRFNQTLVRDPSSGRIVHAPEGERRRRRRRPRRGGAVVEAQRRRGERAGADRRHRPHQVPDARRPPRRRVRDGRAHPRRHPGRRGRQVPRTDGDLEPVDDDAGRIRRADGGGAAVRG